MIKNLIWKERKRLWCRLPWTFTVYGLSDDRIFVDSGILSKKYKDVRLYRVLDVGVSRSLLQRIFGLGTVNIQSKDSDLNDFELKNIPHSEDVKEQISSLVEIERKKNKVTAREWFDDDSDGDDNT